MSKSFLRKTKLFVFFMEFEHLLVFEDSLGSSFAGVECGLTEVGHRLGNVV